jgi:hypothetical protein
MVVSNFILSHEWRKERAGTQRTSLTRGSTEWRKVRGLSTNWQMGVAAAPEMSLSTCSGPAPAPPAAARGIHSAHFAAADAAALPPSGDEGAAGAGDDAEQTSSARRLPLLRAPGFGRGSQLGAAFAAGGLRTSEWRGRRWTAAAIVGWGGRAQREQPGPRPRPRLRQFSRLGVWPTRCLLVGW